LHPRAQAALGSFFCQMVKAADRRLVIESHSDFIVDRVRQEVAAGTIPPDWVRIIFFHREGYETTVYPLRLDAEGNILDCPAFYREFFLREELRLLSRAG
jgi:predicted ATPase